MKSRNWTFAAVTLLAALALPAAAEIVYTPIAVVIPANGIYQLDLNHDGVADFTLRSAVGMVWCQTGDGGYWRLTVQAAPSNGVLAKDENAAALPSGVPVDVRQSFTGGTALMAYLAYGYCGSFEIGSWYNVSNRYLGLEFTGNGIAGTHYGWAKLSDFAYVDQHFNLQAGTMLIGFAYETTPGKTIMTGQTSDAPDNPAPSSGSTDQADSGPAATRNQ
jgi:hypothetical protein